MNEPLNQEQKQNIVNINHVRIENAMNLPFSKRQDALDRVVQDINICLTTSMKPFLDLTLMAHQYIDSHDKTP